MALKITPSSSPIQEVLYPLQESNADNCGVYDLELIPLTGKYRTMITKSRKLVSIGAIEKLSHGTLQCRLQKGIAIVGVYSKGKIVGHELRYRPTQSERTNGIPEWKFDLYHKSMFATAWDFQSTDIFIWTIRGLRKNGKPEKTINLS